MYEMNGQMKYTMNVWNEWAKQVHNECMKWMGKESIIIVNWKESNGKIIVGRKFKCNHKIKYHTCDPFH